MRNPGIGRSAPRLARVALLAAICLVGMPAGALDVTAAGNTLGPIDQTTAFDAAQLRALFPNATVEPATGHSEGLSFPTLQVSESGEVLLEVRSGDGATIHSVEVLSGATAELGVHHGDVYGQVFDGDRAAFCEPGVEEDAGHVLCFAPRSRHLILVFVGDWAGPDGQLPPAETLSDWTVQRIVWLR